MVSIPQKYFFEPDDNSTMLYQFLDTNGDGTGTRNAIGDYSSTPDDFYIQPPAGEVYIIERMIGEIEDTGNFTADGYGAGSALSNGIHMSVSDSSDVEIISLMGGEDIKNNHSWANHCYDLTYHSFGSGNNFMTVRWTFGASGRPIILKNQEKLKLTMSDDLSVLVVHEFFIMGHKGFGKIGNQ